MINHHGEMEGFVVDLVKKMSEIIGFKYRLVVVKDGKYGSPNKDGTYNGVVGELQRNVGFFFYFRFLISHNIN